MGRTLKRVPLDFNWPLNQVWKGYLNPYNSQPCKSCDQSGYNPETKKIYDEWYNFDNAEYVDLPNGRRYNKNAHSNNITQVEIDALIKENRLWNFTRVPRNEKQRKDVEKKINSGGNSWLPYNNGYVPTPDEVNEWNRGSIGHGAINCHICVEARAKHLGVYGLCEYCDGEGEIWQSEEIKQLAENWEPIEPPEGEGFQLWETTSEGSPTSPVFETLEKLAEWCEENATTFAKHKATKEQWIEMLSCDRVHHKERNVIFI